MEARTWEQARVLAAAAALVAAAVHVLSGVFAWLQLGGGVSARLALNTALREVDAVAGVLVLLAAVLLAAPPRSGELRALGPAVLTVATVLLVLGVVQVLNSVTITGAQIEFVDRLQNAFEGGLPAAVLAYAARRIAIGAAAPEDLPGLDG